MSVKEWIRKIIAHYAENGSKGQHDETTELGRNAVELFMKTALQKCANTPYGNVVYREMCNLDDGQRLRVVHELLYLTNFGLELTGAYDTLVACATRLEEAERLMKELGA